MLGITPRLVVCGGFLYKILGLIAVELPRRLTHGVRLGLDLLAAAGAVAAVAVRAIIEASVTETP
jgi:hypothetical protein